MSRTVCVLVSAFALCSCVATGDRRHAAIEAAQPQARPVAMLMVAVREQDARLFQSAFSSRMQAHIAKHGWQKSLRGYAEVFRAEFGEYRPEDFTYAFSGDDAAGVVAVTFKGRKLSGMRVVKEEGRWKVDEK
jgi:hypothetical protein